MTKLPCLTQYVLCSRERKKSIILSIKIVNTTFRLNMMDKGFRRIGMENILGFFQETL